MVTMMTQRGCPQKCGFCATPNLHGRKVRGWDYQLVVDEIERLYFDYGVREISFVDDIFIARPARAKRICQG